MRSLLMGLGIGLFAVTAGAAAACTGMQTAQKDQVVASSSSKAQSTPIPARQNNDG